MLRTQAKPSLFRESFLPGRPERLRQCGEFLRKPIDGVVEEHLDQHPPDRGAERIEETLREVVPELSPLPRSQLGGHRPGVLLPYSTNVNFYLPCGLLGRTYMANTAAHRAVAR
jgi:hypothetical protein